MKKILICCLVIFCSSCTLKEQENLNDQLYFDVDNYFKLEAKRLTKANPQVDKTVNVNGDTEHKKLRVNNWEKEFESFISADINKASWRGAFKVKKEQNLETYLATSDKIPVKKLEITYRNDKIYGIKILIANTNHLYSSKDSLSYYPDSLYAIKKVQQIKLMEQKSYSITGKFR